MPEKNRTYRARIEGYTSEGLGVARIDGQAVFVHRALRGEDCDVLILKVLKNAAFGKIAALVEPPRTTAKRNIFLRRASAFPRSSISACSPPTTRSSATSTTNTSR